MSAQSNTVGNIETLLELRTDPHVDPHPQLGEHILPQELAQSLVVRLRPPEHLLQDLTSGEGVVLPPPQQGIAAVNEKITYL